MKMRKAIYLPRALVWGLTLLLCSHDNGKLFVLSRTYNGANDVGSTTGDYIVWFDEKFSEKSVKEMVREVVPSEYHDLITHIYPNTRGFSVKDFPKSVLSTFRGIAYVASIEEVVPIELPEPVEGGTSNGPSWISATDELSSQAAAYWHLDRISHEDLPLDETYVRVKEGEGVHVYIVDTGIMDGHSEFEGRIAECVDFIGDYGSVCHDGDGHGTHVAALVAGKTFGAASKATIHAIRVLDDNGQGNSADSWAALDYIRPQCPNQKAVVNLSFGGPHRSTINQIVHLLEGAGCTVVVAAGNSGDDACQYSPASAFAAITVGATNIFDRAASFSNYGDCVDVFAPGEDITSAAINRGNTGTRVGSGTSQASPLVAGLMALYVEMGWNAYDFRSAAIEGKLVDATPNLLAQIQPVLEGIRPTSRFSLGTTCNLRNNRQGTWAYMDIFTDDKPEEISWEITSYGGVVDYRNPGFYKNKNTFTREEVCVPPDTLHLLMKDTGEDGYCCGKGRGSYKFTVDSFDTYSFGSAFGGEERSILRDPGSNNTHPVISPGTPVAEEPEREPLTLGDDCEGEFGPGVIAIMTIRTDNFPNETSWRIQTRSMIIATNDRNYTSPNTNYVEEICVPPTGAFFLTVFDSGEDGLCCMVSTCVSLCYSQV